MARRRSKALGSTRIVHEALAKKARERVDAALNTAQKALAEGRCTSAYLALTNAFTESGKLGAEGAHAKGPVWYPQGHFREASGRFADICIKYHPDDLGRTKKRRR